jgi:two-component system response regulator YesN
MDRIPETGPDLEKLGRLAGEYRAATGLALAVVDGEGRTVWSRGDCSPRACTARSRRREEACRSHHARAVREAYRWGEPSISLCPLGLLTIAVPLSVGRTLTGGIVSGFCILPEMKQDIREEIRDRLRRLGVRTQPDRRPRLALPVLSSKELRRAAQLLLDLTSMNGMSDPEALAESRGKGLQQVTIANYLDDARARGGGLATGGGAAGGAAGDFVTSLVGMQNDIIEKVVEGDLAGSREIINRFLGVIFLESGMNFDMLKVRLLELVVIISRAAMERGISADGLLGPRYSYLTAINATTGFDDLFWGVTKALENFTHAVAEERGRPARVHVARMKEFLSRRFATRVRAREVAAAAGLSVSRALHLFSRECGVPLSTWISRLRVDHAAWLLRNTQRSMADIASECGFFDQSHFTRTFKSIEGIPPLRFRREARGA